MFHLFKNGQALHPECVPNPNPNGTIKGHAGNQFTLIIPNFVSFSSNMFCRDKCELENSAIREHSLNGWVLLSTISCGKPLFIYFYILFYIYSIYIFLKS